MNILSPQRFLSAGNFVGNVETTKTTTSTDSASTYQDPWSDDSSLLGSSGSSNKKPPVVTATSEKKKHHTNGDKIAPKKENKSPKVTTHIGADVSACKSDARKVRTDEKQSAVVDSGDEMILDCITVKRNLVDFEFDFNSLPTDDKLSAVKLGKRKLEEPVRASEYYSTNTTPAYCEPIDDSPSKKRNVEAAMGGSLFDEVHSPSVKRRVVRR